MVSKEEVLNEAHSYCIQEFIKQNVNSKCKYCQGTLVLEQEIFNEVHSSCFENFKRECDALENLRKIFANNFRLDWNINGDAIILDQGITIIEPIGEIPEEVFLISGLKELTIRQFKKLIIPDSFRNFKKLRKLAITNKLESIPESIGELESLEELDLSNNLLSSLPDSFVDLSNLTHLNLSNNQFDKIPEVIFELPKLQYLNMERNGIKEVKIPHSFPSLTELNVSKTVSSTKISPSIEFLENLISLDLSNNYSETLPDNLGNLRKLEKLNLMNNGLQADRIPESIKYLKNMKYLNLRANKLKYLPEFIKNLKNLGHLDIGGNTISDFPDCITFLTKLRILDIDGNPISKIPDSIKNLTNLEYLRIMKTNISLESLPFKEKINYGWYFKRYNYKYIVVEVCYTSKNHLDNKEFYRNS